MERLIKGGHIVIGPLAKGATSEWNNWRKGPYYNGTTCERGTLEWDHLLMEPFAKGTTLEWDHLLMEPFAIGAILEWDHLPTEPHYNRTTCQWTHLQTNWATRPVKYKIKAKLTSESSLIWSCGCFLARCLRKLDMDDMWERRLLQMRHIDIFLLLSRHLK